TPRTAAQKTMSPGDLDNEEHERQGVYNMTTSQRNEDPMLRKTFENEIQQVKDDVLVLGSMVEEAILDAVEALKKRAIKASEIIFEEDKAINEKRFEIENKLLVLI